LEGDEIVGTVDSLRWVCGLERPGFGRGSNRMAGTSVRGIAGGSGE